jgi:hypothetical protein
MKWRCSSFSDHAASTGTKRQSWNINDQHDPAMFILPAGSGILKLT